jgi:hypothetical protein
MPLVRCPHCQLPLTDDEARADVCSACGARLRPEASAPVPPAAKRGFRWLLLLVVPLVGIVGWLSWHARPTALEVKLPDAPKVTEVKKAPVAEEKKKETPPEEKVVVVLPPEEKVVVNDAKGRAKKRGPGFPLARAKDLPTDEVVALAKAKGERAAPIVAKPDPNVPRLPMLQNGVLDLNQPGGEFKLPSLNQGRTLKIVGQIKTLRLTSINDGATLDATGLRVETILMDGGVNGRSTVKLAAPKGRVHLRGSINGESTVTIDAPDGVVILSGPNGSSKDVDIINGESKLKIVTRELELQGVINGTQTLLDVTFTKQGRLTYHLLQGQSRVDYRRADPADPQPVIAGGKLLAGAKVQAVD